MNTKLLFIIGGIFVIFSSTTFFVNETQRAMVFQLGEIKRADLKPGLHFKLPLVNNVRKFDARILTIDAQPELFLTSEKKNMSVDFFVKWRIANVKSYYKSTLGGLLYMKVFQEIHAQANRLQLEICQDNSWAQAKC